ncbi:MAG: leucine-rich repeat protein [Verrucomicrobia bacterium]|nr:leucine-rich repeat protein [Verrucomicrobiota bacterium]
MNGLTSRTLLALSGFLLLSTPLSASADQLGDFTYSTNAVAATITGYTGTNAVLTIPSTINSLPVTSIGAWAFFNSTIVSTATIPNSVTTIGDGAFFNCGSLSSVAISNGVTSIGNLAFGACTNLAGVYFQGNAPILSGDVFYNDVNATIYYLAGTTGWGATYGDRPTALWTGGQLTGSLQVTLAPAGVVSAGAQWRVDGGAWRNSGATATDLAAGSHTVGFSSVTNWIAPTNLTVAITSGQTTVANANYMANAGLGLAAGYQHTLALKWNGTVWAWGRNLYGQLGNGGTNTATTAVQVSGLGGVTALAAGYDHTLALRSDGTVWAWGYNAYGQLGNGTTNSASTAVQVSGLSGVVALAAGMYHSAALRSDGTVWAWGYNGDGELGDGTIVNRATAVQVSGLSGVIALAAGTYHSVALKSDGTVWAWGSNFGGQLGDGTTTEHSVALKSDGTVWGWGNNGDGELGDGTTVNRATPVQVSGLSGVTAITAGSRHTLGLKADGTVWGWGLNSSGQLGDGTTVNRSTPVPVSGLNGVRTIAAGWEHNAALKTDGTVWGWGYNTFGAIGDGTTGERDLPVQAVGFTTLQDGSLQVTLGPAGAVSVGAQWRVDGSAWQNSGVTVTNLAPGTHTVGFSAVSDWIAPTNLTVTINSLQLTTTNATYITPASGRAQMLSPANGATLNATSVMFNWSSGTGVDQYALWLGSTAATNDLAVLNAGTNLSQTVTVPANGQALYMRLLSFIQGAWYYYDYNYMAPVVVKAAMLSPANGTTNSSSSVTFTWDAGVGASQYAMWVGSASNSYDLYAAVVGTNLSQRVTVPATGGQIYVRLWSFINGEWQYNEYGYTAPTPAKAVMTSPANGSTNSSASVTLAWNAGAGVSQYALWVGSASNSYDLYAAVEPGLSRTLTLPSDGRQIYVRLWSFLNGGWDYNDYSYRALTAVKARFTGLANGATLGSASANFTWDAGAGVSQYALWVGSSAGGHDLAALATGTNLSQSLTLPSDGRQIYVRLWSLINGTWKQNNYVFTAYTAPLSRAEMLSPTNGATFISNPVTLIWSAGTGVSQYALWVGSTSGSYGLTALLVGTNRTHQLTLPLDGGPICVRLWSFFSGTWEFNDYTYATSGAAVKAQMTSPVNGATLSGASTTFSWSAGTGVSQYAMWAGSTPGSHDLYAAALGTNRTQTLTLPVDGGPVYVRVWSCISNEWKFNDYFYTAFLAP